VIGECRKFHNEELHSLYSKLDTVKGKGKVVPVLLTELHVAKAYCGSGGIAPRIL
jgi:hypothetical protein